MKIWIHLNGVQEGPYELDQLPLDRMTAATPVWYDGMPDWEPAGRAILTAPLFKADTGQHSECGIKADAPFDGSVHPGIANGYGMPASHSTPLPGETDKCPATYIVWSVLLTVLCCNPIGIIPIVLGTNVIAKFRNYDYQGAKRASETTAWWLMITIVTSLILLPFSMLVAL